MKNEAKKHELGTNHSNHLANKNGLDELDRWAMGIGQAEKAKYQITPAKHHVMCYVPSL